MFVNVLTSVVTDTVSGVQEHVTFGAVKTEMIVKVVRV
jgi:hypothetical protein